MATSDFDNDGHVDLLIVAQNAPLALFRNRGGEEVRSAQGQRTHFLTIGLEGTVSNRDGSGARVALTASGKTQVRERLGGGSYLSASDGRLHFGLGTTDKVDRIAVKWPKGRVDVYKDLRADTGYLLREGDSTARTLGGFTPESSTTPGDGK